MRCTELNFRLTPHVWPLTMWCDWFLFLFCLQVLVANLWALVPWSSSQLRRHARLLDGGCCIARAPHKRVHVLYGGCPRLVRGQRGQSSTIPNPYVRVSCWKLLCLNEQLETPSVRVSTWTLLCLRLAMGVGTGGTVRNRTLAAQWPRFLKDTALFVSIGHRTKVLFPRAYTIIFDFDYLKHMYLSS
jgi:hypothetical protein